jgi:RpiR family murPQ operon transcriptional repressor
MMGKVVLLPSSCMDKGVRMVLKPIVDNYPLLSKSEKRIADFFLENTHNALLKSGDDIGRATATSAPTLTRFVKKIGYKNLSDAKVGLAKMLIQPDAHMPLKISADLFVCEGDDYQTCGNKLFAQIHDVCKNALDGMDYEGLAQAVDKIVGARLVHIAGVGSSGIVAQSMFMKLTNIGIPVTYNIDSHINLKTMLSGDEHDVLIAFSYSGSLRETVKTVELAHSRGMFVITICGNKNSPIAPFSDVILQSPAMEQVLRVGAVSSHYSQQFVGDLLFLGIVTKTFDNTKYCIDVASQYMDGWRLLP